MICKNSFFLLLLFELFSLNAFSKIVLPSILGNGMVLQQQSSIKVWGTAGKNLSVAVHTSWNNVNYTTRSNPNGEFEVLIHTPSAGGPYQITFNDGEKLVLNDILIGEVWFCSGQSNMDMPVGGYLNQPVDNANDLLTDAANFPIRLFKVRGVASSRPLTNTKAKWTSSDAENLSAFSAVGYQFAKILQQQLHVPVGIIQSTWGGTNITSWMNSNSLKSFPEIKIASDTTSVVKSRNATSLFNGMINPLLNFKIRGAIWYQGEANRSDPENYSRLLQNMVTEWRKLWNSGDFPFYYVQIAPWEYTSFAEGVPYLQEAQYKAMNLIPNSGMVVSVDAGSATTIHPPDKTTISKRLAYWALAKTYEKKGIRFQSPSLKTLTINANLAELTFEHAEHGLYSSAEELTGFEIAGEDRKFYAAKGKITKTGISLQAEQVEKPVAVRYAFTDWVKGTVYNTAGLPLTPFRSDKWPIPNISK